MGYFNNDDNNTNIILPSTSNNNISNIITVNRFSMPEVYNPVDSNSQPTSPQMPFTITP